jgi:hypothetical protein
MPVGARWRAGFLKLITIFMRRAGAFYQIPNTTWSYSIKIIQVVIDERLGCFRWIIYIRGLDKTAT